MRGRVLLALSALLLLAPVLPTPLSTSNQMGGAGLTTLATAGIGASDSSAPTELRAPPTLASTPITVTSFTASPETINVSTPTNLTVNVTGGTPPLTFAYRNLPVGCPSWNGPRIRCFPLEFDTFLVQVQVTDAVGDVANASTNLTVLSGYGGAPEILSFSITPSEVGVGHPTTLAASATSRSSTPTLLLSYGYSDLPRGCATFNQTPLTCVPSQSGVFRVELLVTDGFGDYSAAYANLTVVGGPPAGSNSSGATSLSSLSPYLIVGGIAIVALMAAAFLVPHRRRRRPPSGWPPDGGGAA